MNKSVSLSLLGNMGNKVRVSFTRRTCNSIKTALRLMNGGRAFIVYYDSHSKTPVAGVIDSEFVKPNGNGFKLDFRDGRSKKFKWMAFEDQEQIIRDLLPRALPRKAENLAEMTRGEPPDFITFLPGFSTNVIFLSTYQSTQQTEASRQYKD